MSAATGFALYNLDIQGFVRDAVRLPNGDALIRIAPEDDRMHLDVQFTDAESLPAFGLKIRAVVNVSWSAISKRTAVSRSYMLCN